MQLRQQIVQDRIEDIARRLSISSDQAFLRFVYSLLTGQSIYAIDESDIVDGGQDKQIDVITIDRNNHDATVYIIQAKNTASFSSNSLIQMSNGLSWIFGKPRSELATLTNPLLREKIEEYRSLQSELGPSNINVVVAFATNGISKSVSVEFDQECRSITSTYDNRTFASFQLRVLGADELVELMNSQEDQRRRVDATIRMKYDASNPSLIRYFSGALSGLICTVNAMEIARIVNENNESGAVFDANIRRYLGTKRAVNADILHTCSDTALGAQFWFLNNGITIVCEHFEAVTDPDNPVVKLKNMQIVNGCQTATTLALAAKANMLAPDVRVLLRIYEATSSPLVNKIVLTTNNQNPINSRDLMANDSVQEDMERALLSYGYFYERKNRQYDSVPDIDPEHILANQLVGQCYLAVVLKRPSVARARRSQIWGELYKDIFSGSEVEPYLIACLIYRVAVRRLKETHYLNEGDKVRHKLASHGAFFLARIASCLWRGNDQYKIARSQLQGEIRTLEDTPDILDSYVDQSIDLLEEIVTKNPDLFGDLDRALKSGQLDSEIDRVLNTRGSYYRSRAALG